MMRIIWRKLDVMILALTLAVFTMSTAGAMPRIKDIVDVENVRENQLVGYGLVVGLNGTGDRLRNNPFTRQSLEAMLERLGVNTRDATNIDTDNVAAVMVTANLPPFARQGGRIDVNVSSLGDAEDLRGGTLLVTPLMGADGEVYAVAQGPIAVAGFAALGEAAAITQGVPTAGRIPNGAIVEREIPFEFGTMSQVKLSLRNPDLTTAMRIAATINRSLDAPISRAIDPATVQLERPAGFELGMLDMLTQVEQLTVEPDQAARVVIDDRSGVIVMGSDVRVSTVAIAQGNLTIRVTETPVASQPSPLSEGGQTEVLPRSDIEIDTGEDNRLAVVEEGVTLQDLVDGLNSLGVGPRDMISILQAIKAAGALHAEIEVM